MKKHFITIGTLKKIGLNINLPALNVDILKYEVYCHITHVLEVFPMWLLVINSIIVRC